MEIESLGARIMAARKQRRLEQKDLGEAIGVHEKTISKWENDRQPPELESIERMAEVLGVSPSWLRTGRQGSLLSEGVREPPPRTMKLPLPVRQFIQQELADYTNAGASEDEVDDARRVFDAHSNYAMHHGGFPADFDETKLLRILKASAGHIRDTLKSAGRKPL